jgi:hypothetical protein
MQSQREDNLFNLRALSGESRWKISICRASLFKRLLLVMHLRPIPFRFHPLSPTRMHVSAWGVMAVVL